MSNQTSHQNEPSSGIKILKILIATAGVFFSFNGFVWLIIGLFFYIHSNNSVKSAERAEGTVVQLVRSSDSTTYAPVVVFLDQSGQRIEFTSNMSSNPPAYSRGEKISVLYDPKSPEQAKIDSFVELWLFPLIFSGIGVFFLLPGLLMLYFSLRRKKTD